MSEQMQLGYDRAALGLDIHRAEMTIHVGREAVNRITAIRPVDEVALRAQRDEIRQAKDIRHAVLAELNMVRDSEQAF